MRKRRIELGISQRKVAEFFEVSEDTITYWENERVVPQVQHYPKVIEFLGYYPFPIDDKSIGGQIRKYRYEHGYSFRKLAEDTGHDPATLASWEENETMPSLEHRMKLVIFGILK